MTGPRRLELQPVWFQKPKFFADLIQQVFTGHTPCGRHCARLRGFRGEGTVPALKELLRGISTFPENATAELQGRGDKGGGDVLWVTRDAFFRSRDLS